MTERERIRRALGPLHASDTTMEEVLAMIQREQTAKHGKHTGRNTLRTALIAAALVLALSVTAYAVGEYTDFFETVFGDKAIESEELYHETLTDDEGNVWKEYDYPAVERVAVDPDEAQDLVGRETVNVSQSVKVRDVTFTVEDFVIDANGIGVLTYTMEDPNGFPGLTQPEYGSNFWFEDPDAVGSQRVAQLALTDGTGGTVSSLDSIDLLTEGGTDTKKTVVSYFAPFQPIDGAEYLTMTFAVVKEHDADAMLYEDVVETGSVSFPLSEAVPARTLTASDGWSASVSPVGLVITPPEGDPYGDDYGFGEMVIHMADGSDYVLEQTEPYTSNVTIGCFGEDHELCQVFNRLIDPDQVESVTAVGRASGYQDESGRPVPWDQVSPDGETLREGLTELDVDLDLTFTK